MAERRMFSKSVIDSDPFVDMPVSAQLLYFHLGMHADDDGFVSNPKQIQRSVGCSADDIKLLAAKSFIITFESGIVVITHWKLHNYIQKDRYKPTFYQIERSKIRLDKNNVYTLYTDCIQNVYTLDTQDSIGEVSIVKDSLGEGESEPNGSPPTPSKPKFQKFGEYSHVKLTQEQYQKLIADFGEAVVTEYIRRVDEYQQQTGKSYKDYSLTIRHWINKDTTEAKKNVKGENASLDFAYIEKIMAERAAKGKF